MASYSEAHICQCLSRLGTGRRDSTVTINGGRRKTGMQFVEGVMGIAHGLLQLGIELGDVVSISALNSDLYLEWLLAITYVGGIAAPLNYRWSLEEAKSAMEVARPVLLVTDSSQGYWHSKFDIGSVQSLRWHVLMDVPVNSNTNGTIFASESLQNPVEIDYVWAPERAAIICFTSGTTGKPKGATLSHSALVMQSLAKIAIVRYDEDDVYLHTAPLCHIGGISSAMAMLMAGGCHVIIPKFEANLACGAIRKYSVTSLITVPAMMADLISFHRTKETSRSFKSVKKILNGGGGLSCELLKDAIMIFPRAMILSAYGMTEACSSLTFIPLYDPKKGIHSYNVHSTQDGICVGKPAPHVELKLRLDEYSDSGRILTRGPHTMLGYWGQSPSNQSEPTRGSWLDTGDIGCIDGYGNLWLVGREKDRIKSGGENIYPEEVEAVLCRHPGLSGVVVVGVPDSRLTEMVTACVRLKDGWRWADSGGDYSAEGQIKCLSAVILRQFCREKNLTGPTIVIGTGDELHLNKGFHLVLTTIRFKIPKRFVLWKKKFQLTSTGKLRRDRVRAQVMSHNQLLSSKL